MSNERAPRPSQSNSPLRTYSLSDFDGSRAAPLLLVGDDMDPELDARQNRIIEHLQAATRVELAQYASPSVIEFAGNAIVSRMHSRAGYNSQSYMQRANLVPDTTIDGYSEAEILEACDRARRGEGRMKQNHIAHLAFRTASVEYLNLTEIAQFRAELEEPMWEELSDFVGADARPTSAQMYKKQILSYEGSLSGRQPIGALHVDMKRRVPNGLLEDGTEVKVRTTAVINTRRHNGFDGNVLDALREAKHEKRNLNEVPEFLAYIDQLVDNELPPGVVLTRNETVFGANPVEAELHRERKNKEWETLISSQAFIASE